MPADALVTKRSLKHCVCEWVILEVLWPAENSVVKVTALLHVV